MTATAALRIAAAGIFACLAAIPIAACQDAAPSGLATAAGCPAPATMVFRVEGEIHRDTRGFTQGLELHDSLLFESTGALAGDTRLNMIGAGGAVTELANFGKTFFGEGLTILDDRIYQLSWQDNEVYVYSLDGTLLRTMENERDGWGLTNDGTQLLFTDGGDRIYYAVPETFAVNWSFPVRAGGSPLAGLNELEYVDGKIYGNIFLTRGIVRVDPASGCVEAIAELSELWDRMDGGELSYVYSDSNFVLNGIAHDPDSGLFYLTGKNWGIIFTGRFEDTE